MSFCNTVKAQTEAWNPNSFKFSRDTISPENMAGATSIIFSGSPVESSPALSVPGFSFRFGLSSYNTFYISPYGFVKFGSPIVSNTPENDSTVIVPLCNGTYWNASYKITGAAPDRKLVIQYIGVMQPSGEPTWFQVWLYERTGKIQFVYNQLRGYYGFTSSWSYKVFCSTTILKQKNSATIKVNPNNAAPAISYNALPLSFDSIYTHTRYTFEPDTIKPTIPSALSFSNIQSGCLTANITEASGNESEIVLERADSGTNYKFEKIYYTASPAGNTTYNYTQTLLQPFWTYNYRTYVTNGFLNSDTLYNSVQTLMPQINGIKSIPGDYPSITALLQDAACKHLGPDLVIELQNNYNFSAETLPIAFNPGLQTRLIHSITIRPAANATINWADSTAGALFYVDSVKHVFLDGRPGGTGTAQNLTIFQKNPQVAAIQYTNVADSGGINYCRIIKKNSTYLTYAVVVVPKSYAYNYPKKDINNFTITNNFISADSATVSDLVYINPADSLKAQNFIISGNQFSRFRRSAIHFENGGENLQIANNSFYQPEIFKPEVFLPYTHAACISLINTGKATIDNNFFGGGSATWGAGKFRLNLAATDFSFINYQNNSLTKKAFITNNKFGNIEFTGYSYHGSSVVYAFGGDVLLDHNQFGTADSVNSITAAEYFWGVDLWYGTKTFTHNFLSGFQGSYLTSGTSNHSYLITTSFTDSCAFINNDIGGSNNPLANSSTGVVHGLYLSSLEKNVTIKNNVFRGISSKNISVFAISGANAISNILLTKLEVDSNTIHHIQAASNVAGIILHVGTQTANRVSYNNIYALKTTGTAAGTYGPEGVLKGIDYSIYNFGSSPAQTQGEVRIFGNKIHSFESIRILPNSTYSYYGIMASCAVTKIYNNEISFGLDNKGQFIDSVTTVNGIAITPIDYQTFLSDKHFIEHNTIYFGGKGLTGSAISAKYSYNYVSPKNSITITNNIINIDRIPTASSYISPDLYQGIASIQAYSAKNIWYSSSITNTPALLQAYKQSCHCDSSSFTGNPAFINATGDSTSYNLHLGVLSKADSSGTPSVLNIQTDLDNNNRNAYSPVDIGCYAVTPCGSGTLPSITITSPVSDSIQLCAGSAITLKSAVSGGTFSSFQWQRNLIDSAGAIADSLTINREGNYRLVGKTACGTVASRMIYVVGSALQPSVSISTPALTVCSGTAVTFTAVTSNNITPPSYQWQVNGINTGTNSNIYTTSVLTNNAQVKVITSSTSCGVPVAATSNVITMAITPSPVANAGADIAICTGGSTALTATGGTSYVWTPTTGLSNPAIANPVASPAVTTSYIVTVSNGGACSSKDTVVVTVIPQAQNPVVNISTPVNTICSGSLTTFTATAINGGSAPNYQWQVNAVNAGINSNSFTSNTLNNNDKVQVILTSNAACVSNNTATSNIITMNVQQLATPIVTLNNKVFTVTNPDNAAVYTWQQLSGSSWINVIPAATGITFTAASAGTYRVMAVKGVCTVYSTSQITNLRTGVPNNPYGIYLYPNPATSSITLDGIQVAQNWETLSIIDSHGQEILPPFSIKNKSSITVNVSELSSGTYFVLLKRQNGEFTTIGFIKI